MHLCCLLCRIETSSPARLYWNKWTETQNQFQHIHKRNAHSNQAENAFFCSFFFFSWLFFLNKNVFLNNSVASAIAAAVYFFPFIFISLLILFFCLPLFVFIALFSLLPWNCLKHQKKTYQTEIFFQRCGYIFILFKFLLRLYIMRIDLFSFVHFDFEVKQMHFNASFSLLIEEVDKKNVSKQSNSATEKKNNLNFSVVTTDEEQCFSTHQKRTKKKIQHGIPKNEFLILFFSFIFFLPSHSSCCLFLVKKMIFFLVNINSFPFLLMSLFSSALTLYTFRWCNKNSLSFVFLADFFSVRLQGSYLFNIFLFSFTTFRSLNSLTFLYILTSKISSHRTKIV